MDAVPTLLFVCHANLCRSPMAERLALVLGGGVLRAASAGTHASPGLSMHASAESTLREMGADPSGFTSRQISPSMVAQADLVLTADRVQRSACVDLAPVAVRRTFTIRQFGRLACAALEAGTGHGDLLVEIARARAEVTAVPADEDDLADPVHGTRADFLACARQLAAALEPTVALIAAPRPGHR